MNARAQGLPRRLENIVLVADLAGTAVFAVEGAISAMRAQLDLLGVMVIAFIVALGGGVTRDLLIGATPPKAVADWRYPALALLMGGLAFVARDWVLGWSGPLLILLDAAGLGLFAVAGTQKAQNFGISPFVSMLMGTVTGVGGRGDSRHCPGPHSPGAAGRPVCQLGLCRRGQPGHRPAPGRAAFMVGLAGGHRLFRPAHALGALRLATAQGLVAADAGCERLGRHCDAEDTGSVRARKVWRKIVKQGPAYRTRPGLSQLRRLSSGYRITGSQAPDHRGVEAGLNCRQSGSAGSPGSGARRRVRCCPPQA